MPGSRSNTKNRVSAKSRFLRIVIHIAVACVAASRVCTKPRTLLSSKLNCTSSEPTFRRGARTTSRTATLTSQILSSITTRSKQFWTGRWPATTRGGWNATSPSSTTLPLTISLIPCGPCWSLSGATRGCSKTCTLASERL